MTLSSITSAYATPVGAGVAGFVGTTLDRTSQALRRLSGSAPPERPSEAVKDLRLSHALALRLNDHFNTIGYELQDDTERFASITERRYTAAISLDSSAKFALLNFPPEILMTTSEACLESFAAALLTFKDMPCRILSVRESASGYQHVPALRHGYKRALEKIMSMSSSFINWDDIADFLNGSVNVPFGDLVGIRAGAAASSAPKSLTSGEINAIVEYLASLAAAEPAGIGQYFRNLVQRTDWPESLKRRLIGSWSGNANNDALQLVASARLPFTYPTGHAKQGQSLLGWMLWQMIENNEVGHPTDQRWARWIIDFNLVNDPRVLNELDKLADR